ncbi:MAG TPA: hypothetical protein VFL27_02345, partial [Candidatus Dormibacteraeota bacterium]|nr:hypothetical protein [Candidatus Dormibacteraeota bacterium]
KSVDHDRINTSASTATFNYTVSVHHDEGTISNVKVTGTISVTNPNADAVNIDAINDKLSTGDVCTVTDGGPQSIASGVTTFAYECDLSSVPAGDVSNTVTISWPSQNIADGLLVAGKADFTAPVSFAATPVDSCVEVNDTLGGDLGAACVGDQNPKTFSYPVTIKGTPGTCVPVDNTATFTTNTTGSTGSDSASAKLCVGEDLQVSKTANPTFTRTFKWGISKSVDKTLVQQSGDHATFNYTVTVTHDAGTDSGWQVSGTIKVTNPNDWEAITADIADAIDNGGSCTVTGGDNVSIPAGGSMTATYVCTFSGNPGSGTNTATATWDAAAAFTPDGSSSGDATYAFGDPTTIVDGSVSVSDSMGGSLGTVSYTEASPKDIIYAITITGTPGKCVTDPNTATFTTSTTGGTGSAGQSVTLCVGADLQVSKTAATSFTRTFTWGIAKSVDKTLVKQSGTTATFNYTVSVTHDAGTDSNWAVSGDIQVTNPNDWEDIVATVSDSIDNNGTCIVPGGGVGIVVPRGGAVSFHYTCSYTAAPTLASGTNTATAHWDKVAAFTPDASSSGTAGYAFGDPTTIVDGSVSVTDTLGGALGTVAYTDPSPTSFKYSFAVTGIPGTCVTQDNTATFTTSDTNTTGSDSKTVKLCVGEDLQVSKTATPSFTRTYTWTIAKSVNKNFFDAGGTATYSVLVMETGWNDSNFQVSGLITVSNPNDWESITANVSDLIDHSGSCTVTGGTSLVIAPNGAVNVAYTCSFASNPGSGTNTGTATWNASTFFTPDGTASGTAHYSFGAPTATINAVITVTDSFQGTLGTASATDTPPFTPTIFNYTRHFNPPSSGCVTINNTATIVETGQTASASVRVCNTGALTMGFWQNKNGQAIITKGQSTAGVCNSGTWLRNYAPFQDLSATATCSQVGAYVSNIIGAANAGGATMNAMLKAQMLATALDVYFSDNSLGGNQIGAPAPIGGITIDLTKIYGSENASGAFGGHTSMTVSQMLAWAAGQSNSGGSSWYGQNKATQGLAKDAFDSVNNQNAVSP